MDVINYSYLNVGGDRRESVLYRPYTMTLSGPAIYWRTTRTTIVSRWIVYAHIIRSGKTAQQIYCTIMIGILTFGVSNTTKMWIVFQYIVVINTVDCGFCKIYRNYPTLMVDVSILYYHDTQE